MNDPQTSVPATAERNPISDRSGVTDSVRVQILATEHWSLLATRSMTWNEVFSRASMFITLLSSAVVALALVAQAIGFGERFRLFALLVLPVVLLVGITTFIRLGQSNHEDFGLIIGMNRLRNAYLELAPELQPYFTTGYHDDHANIMKSYGLGHRLTIMRVLGGTPPIVAAINVIVAGVIAALISEAFGATSVVNTAVGIVCALITILVHAKLAHSSIRQGITEHHPRFPGSEKT